MMDELSRQEVDTKFAAAEARVVARLANLEAAMRIGFAELRVEIESLQRAMHKNTTNLIEWLVITALGFATLTIGILTFVINSSRQAEPRADTTVQRMGNRPTPPLRWKPWSQHGSRTPGAWELAVVAAVLPYTAPTIEGAMKIGTPLDNDNGPPDYHAMEARIAKLEAEVTAIKIDVAVIKLTCATKTDLAELKAELKAAISDGQTKIIVWVVSAIIFAQLLPVIKDSLTPSATVSTHAPAPRGR